MPVWLQIALAIGMPIFAAGGAYMGVEVRMKWHWAEIQRAHARIDRHELKIENLEHA
jgi:hypothetical protein